MATSPTTRVRTSNRVTYANGYSSDWTRLVSGGPLVQVTTPFERTQSVITSQRTITSTSTKPWPTGHPTVWTPHDRVWYSNNGGSGSITIWDTKSGLVPRYVRYYSNGEFEAACFQSSKWELNKVPAVPGTAAVSSKLRGKLKDDFNAGVALAEVNKSVALVASVATRIGKALLAVKSGNTKRALELLGNPKLKKLNYRDRSAIRRKARSKRERQAASAWLELQYGWMPLYNDVYNAIEHATRKAPPGDPIVRCASSEVVRSDVKLPWSSNPFGVSMTQRYILSGKVGRRMVVQYKIADDFLARISNVGLTNPLVVAWELVPFSFAVDWFLPLGEWLSGLDATMGLTFVRGSSTWYYNVEQKVEFATLKTDKNADGFFGCSQTFVEKHRSGMSSFPGIERPYVKSPISTGHAANALALLVSIFHK